MFRMFLYKNITKRKFMFIICSAFTIFFTIYYYIMATGNYVNLGEGESLDLSEFSPFEPVLNEDFPPADAVNSRIPAILHQTWKDGYIPEQFVDNVRSFYRHNPDFKYMFWTDASARLLIKERHPYLLKTFDEYVEPVRRADLLRYVVLFEFGGVYADLDTECLRPLNRILSKYACVLSPEPYEHSSLVFNSEFMLTNSIMFCRSKHPFMKHLMKDLPAFSHFSQDIDASGPNYVTLKYKEYKESRLANWNKESDDFVFVPSSQFFQNELDPVRFSQFRKMCYEFTKLNRIGKRGCVSLKLRGLVRTFGDYTYTRHAFYHTGYKIIAKGSQLITDILPHAYIYKQQV